MRFLVDTDQPGVCESVKLMAFPCNDLTVEVDQDNCFFISDHNEIVGVQIKDVTALVESLLCLLRATAGRR